MTRSRQPSTGSYVSNVDYRMVGVMMDPVSVVDKLGRGNEDAYL